MHPLKLIAIITLAAAAAPAFAQSWYAGASAGTTRSEVDAGRIDGDLLDLGFLSSSTSSDTSDRTLRLFAGRRVLPWLDVEAYYADLGKTRFDSVVIPGGSLSARIKTRAYGIVAIAGFSPAERMRLYAKAGVSRTDARANFSSSGFVELVTGSTSQKQTSGVYGVGAQYALTPRVSLRLEYDVHDKVGGDAMGGRFQVQSATFGVLMPF